MPRIFVFAALALLALSACTKDEPKVEPTPTVADKPVVDEPPPVVDDAPALPTPADDCPEATKLKKKQYAVEDEMQFLRASVVAKTRADLPAPPALPSAPAVNASCEDRVDHAKAVTGLLAAHRDQLKAQLSGAPAEDEKKPDEKKEDEKKADEKKADEKKADDDADTR